MNIDRVDIDGLYTYAEPRSFPLPARGITLVVGANGTGKSSMIEAVGWTLWGETLRGETPHADTLKRAVLARVALSGVGVVERKRKTRAALSLNDALLADLASAAQPKLDALLPVTFDMWRRTCVLSSTDAENFTRADDEARKVLVEELLGLEVFDRAHDRLTEKFRNAQREEADALVHEARAKQELSRVCAVLEAYKEEAATFGERVPREEHDAASARLVAARASEESARATFSSWLGEEHDAKALWSRLKVEAQSGVCGACGQSVVAKVSDKDVQDASLRVLSLQNRTEQAHVALRAAENDRLVCERALSELESRERVAMMGEQARARVAKAEASLHSAEAAVEEARVQRESAARASRIAAAARATVSMSGVRGHLLGGALAYVSEQATAYASNLFAHPVAISLKTTSDTKAGKPRDKLSVTIVGVGAGTYASLSMGQRRRVDIAILLALGDVARRGRGGGMRTLFFDEVFDSLDRAGVEAVIELLLLLSREWSLVVVAHNPHVIAGLKPHAARVYDFDKEDPTR